MGDRRMKLSKLFTAGLMLGQLGLAVSASADQLDDLSSHYPHIRACYQVDAEALKATAPRLLDLSRDPALKEFSPILQALKTDFERRSKDTDYNTRWWFAVNKDLNHEQLSQADGEFEKTCKNKLVEMEREYIQAGLQRFSFVSQSQNKTVLDGVVGELTQQIESPSAHTAE
jgi:hypothetical protein